MNRITTGFYYLGHLLRGRKWDSFHSPYLFKLFTYCCDLKNENPIWVQIEKERKKLLQSRETITRTDYGAGPLINKQESVQKVSSIAKMALSRPSQCRFMSLLARFSDSQTILEFGTSLGISTAYLAVGNPASQVISVEGDAELVNRARQFFINTGLNNIRMVNSTFEEFISNELEALPPIDLVFLDGNHRSEALLLYYNALLPKVHSGSIIIVDDINWSKDMQAGWQKLKERPEITQSVDCFHFGLLFFRTDFLNKENHEINFRF